MAHKHSIYDCDTHFSIDLKTREIKNDIGKTVIVQNDHNSERFSFELPKEIEGHDMSLCNMVQVHYLNIDAKTKAQHIGLYTVDDLQISPDGDDVVILSWLLSQEATRAVGSLYFGIVFKCIEEDGTLTYSWHTTVNKDFKVVESLDNSNVIIEEYPDIFAQFEARLAAIEKNGTDSGSGLTEEQAADLAANTEARHSHENIDVLNALTPDVMERFDNTEEQAHTHANRTVLDKISESESGVLLYDGKEIVSGAENTESTGSNVALATKYFANDVGCYISTSTYADDNIDFEIYEKLPENAVIYDIGIEYDGKNYTSNKLVQNNLIGNQAAVHIYGEPSYSEDFGTTLIASIVNNSDMDTLYNDIVNYGGKITGFTIYYMIANGSNAETDSIDIIPDYVITEAESVIDRVIAAQGNRTFTFAAITDIHYGNGNYTDGIKHACQAMKYIDERIKLDAVAVLGDYADSYPATEYENAIGDFKEINSVLADLRFAPNLRIQGNHDYYADHSALVHRFIQSHSDNVVWGDKAGGYFYRDFEEFKLRVICVNTTETGNANIGCSTAQFEWFINSLDLTAKEDVAEWQILVLSHHPLDWYTTDSTYRFAYYLNGYKNGASGTAGGIAYDFTGKNSATLIGNIHGHIHNLLTDYINIGNINTSNPTTVMRMCTPEACINRANQYDGWKEDTAYNKTVNTAQDTSFVIYCVDLDTNVITAVCYGAGYDRKVNYAGEAITYKVTYNLTNVISSNTDASVSENAPYNAYLRATSGEIVSIKITMGGIDITNTVYSNGVIAIPIVSGDIVITASAQEEEAENNLLTSAIASDGSAYNGGQGWKTGYRLGSAGTESAQNGMEVTGFIPVTKADTIYLSGVSWAYDSASSSYFYLHFYDSNFTKLTGQKMSERLGTADEYVTYDGTNPVAINVQKFCNYTGYTGDAIAYFRISAEEINANSVITVNEPIE